jgi:Cu+-exporting ATPase
MDVDPDRAAAKSDYGGATYYFCAQSCKESFDVDPQKYLSGSTPAPGTAPKRWWEFWKA